MMKRISLLLALFLCAAAALGANVPAGRAEEAPPETARQLVEKLVSAWDETGKKDPEALSRLKSLDPSLAEKWERVMTLLETPVPVGEALPDGLPDDGTLCVIVLGFRLDPDGTMQEELIGRLTTALAAARKYPRALIACTGGATATDDPSATEAGRMAQWLEEHGVDPARLIVEDRSRSTVDNAVFTVNILTERYPEVRQIALISSDYHVGTGALLFGAEAVFTDSPVTVVCCAAWAAPGSHPAYGPRAGMLLRLPGSRPAEPGPAPSAQP